MRSCLALFVWLVLAAACAYSVWQVRLLRQDVDQLQTRLVASESPTRESVLEHARAALEALGRGELEVAQDELDRAGQLIEQTRTLAAAERDRLTRRLAAARKAVAEGSATATDFVRELVQDLSRSRDAPQPEDSDRTSAEP